jgi:hypothetical protein
LCNFNSEINGAPEEIRTPNLLIRSQMLYPVELRARAVRKPHLVGGGQGAARTDFWFL